LGQCGSKTPLYGLIGAELFVGVAPFAGQSNKKLLLSQK
jgi:hypothetical protein